MMMSFLKLSLVIVMCVTSGTLSGKSDTKSQVRRMFMKRSSSDLDGSRATGYIYRQDGTAPASIVYLQPGEVIGHFQGNPLPYTYAEGLGAKSYVINHSGNSGAAIGNSQYYASPYKQHPAFRQAEAYTAPQTFPHVKQKTYKPVESFKPIPSYTPTASYKAVPVKETESPKQNAAYKSSEESGSSEEYETIDGDNNSGSHENYDNGLRRYGYGGDDYSSYGRPAAYTHQNYEHHGGHDGHDSHFKKEDGSEYGEDQFSKHGHKGSKGYKNEHEYSKGDKGSHANEHHTGYYDKHGGNKGSHYDEADNYGQHYKGDKGSKGGKFGEKKHHKKGSKTTGYHNVFHKDEYKKDHTFYDDADHKGHFNKYGSDHNYNKNDAGKHKSGGHHEAGHEEGHHGKKGHTDKGGYDSADTGYKKHHGHDQYHAHDEDYGKKGGSEHGNEHKYAKNGHGHGY